MRALGFRALGFVVGFTIMAIVAAVLTLVWAGLALGAGNAWILEETFAEGWHAVWDRWFVSLLWAWLFLSGVSVLAGSSK